MKQFAYNIVIILSTFTFVSCYEGENLHQIYENQFQDAVIEYVQVSEVNQISATITLSLDNAKYGSEVRIYYSDQSEIDLITEGKSVVIETDENGKVTQGKISACLVELMPDTEYRYCATYKDEGDHDCQSNERTFKTKTFLLYSSENWRDRSYTQIGVGCTYSNLVAGTSYGVVVGYSDDVTLDNCFFHKEFGKSFNKDIYFEDIVVENLIPDSTYYFRAYAKYKGRCYYQESVSSAKTKKVTVQLGNEEIYYRSSGEVEVYGFVSYTYPDPNNPGVSVSNDSPNDPIHKLFETGFQISTSPNFATMREIPVKNESGVRIENIFKDLTPNRPYYVRTYFRWADQMEIFSKGKVIGIPKARLEGDIDSLCIRGQMMPFVLVKAGTFTMGATTEQETYAREDEYPAHQVTITNDFYISQYALTNGMVEGSDDMKTILRSRADAISFIEGLRDLSDNGNIDMPTEAEWEYAARGGHLYPEQTLFAGSNVLSDVALLKSDPALSVYTVKQKKPNALNLYDMSGNYGEWTKDAYRYYYYYESPAVDPYCLIDDFEMYGDYKTFTYVVRGGSNVPSWKAESYASYRVSARECRGIYDDWAAVRLIIRTNQK